MDFLKKKGPLLLCFLTGFVFAVRYYVPHEWSKTLIVEVSNWMKLIAALVFVLGVASVIQQHSRKIGRVEEGFGYSVVLFVAFAGTILFGIIAGGKFDDPSTGKMTVYGWTYKYIFTPLNATMFALLAFFVASAAFRAFRAKTVHAALLLTFALLMLFGKAPLGQFLWDATIGAISPKVPSMASISEWIMNYVNAPARRAILIGVAVGGIATSIKIILGIERSWLGGGGRE